MPHIYTVNVGNMRIEYTRNETDSDNKTITIAGARNVGGNLIIPEEIDGCKVTVIGKKAFLGNSLLSQVTVPLSVCEIQDYAFAQCSNLKTVFILNNNIKLGNSVFTECNSISDICMGYDKTDDVSALLGTLVYRLKAEHIISDNLWGNKEWFEKWDKELLAFLRQEDEDGYTDLVLCGEEDIKFSLDEFICNKRKNKATLCLIRLMHNSMLSDKTEKMLKEYILDHIKGCSTDEAWQALLSEFPEDVEYFRLFAELGGVNENNLDDMLIDMGEVSSETKVFLMNYKQEKFGEKDVFDMFDL
ncbi:MAG: leucine-rich repeat protein [Coprococcus sp.]